VRQMLTTYLVSEAQHGGSSSATAPVAQPESSSSAAARVVQPKGATSAAPAA
ncbi:hypothetical protein L195_g063375, partial [Trifolium pratense]